ncbi:septum formation inhibitor Maf [Rathayibacter sp. AY1G1]|nr:septum formation inhibitor Maf [Rathayibacter sp. AY1A7]PPF30363.1 septum formation inhibitor Maf [Rathayibacter sp. AY1F2]PPF48937.1 septum formation inhibitor Maf [Rathayibacter sp. AY1A1]PPF59295.1 septum formation inhibitor Maf [Rathayibacter sp. AY1C2]PPF73636.1 septum formation inhibitor Maf [Rathayibacter sp. AY1E6]PPG10070.1 septum formation inhibitor Maf [Rathayibacter sp. AY2B1]PPG18427.1 septum formation inhibitor Maf [Rathayibacter sp. AY1C6]PPG44650.1 septum formation inhibit
MLGTGSVPSVEHPTAWARPQGALVRLYLASTSPARLALLRASGIEPVVVPSEVDEPAAVARAEQERGAALDADATVSLLARAKAHAVLRPDIDGLVLGGDSAFVLDGVVHGKPHEPERARERWRAQRGRTGRLHSGHWLVDHRGGRIVAEAGAVTSAAVTFADDIDDAEIDAYVATGEPLEVAGAFTIDGRGAGFITAIEGDPSTVIGMSVPTLRTLVRSLGVDWTALWNR